MQACHTNCTSTDKEFRFYFYDQLLQKLPLKHLDITWNHSSSNPDSSDGCPAVEFIRELLCRNLSGLHSLGIKGHPGSHRPQFPLEGWAPVLMELRVLDLGSGTICNAEPEFVKQVISAAPNLRKLRGNVSSGTLEVLPKSTYKLLDSFSLSMFTSAQDERNCLELAQAGPALSNLNVTGLSSSFHSGGQLTQSFFQVLQQLLNSSCHSLIEFQSDLELFRPSFIKFPVLHSLSTIKIVSQDRGSRQMDILKSINYPKLLTTISTVWLTSLEHLTSLELGGTPGNPLENHRTAARQAHNYSSNSVKELVILGDLILLKLNDLSGIFPNVSSIRMIALAARADQALYEDLWAAWPDLVSLDVREPGKSMGMNFDAQFLGIHPEEVERLREFDDEFLGKMNIVPVRPSILTMSRK